MSPFTVDAARALPGPERLRARRVAAAEALAAASLPSAEEEIWRYSRIAELDLDRLAAPAARDGDAAGTEVLTDDDIDAIGSVMTTPTDVFALANTAFMAPRVITIAAGQVVDAPIVIDHVLGAGSWFPRTVVIAGADSEVAVLERFTSADGSAVFVAPVTEIHAGPAARVRHLSVNELALDAWSIGSVVAVGDRDSTIHVAAVALGGDYARLRIDARAAGQGAHTEQTAVYFGEGGQMHDFRTLQDHAAPKTTSNLLFKGAVEGHSRSVYTGLIKVRKEAPGTTAFQTNRNIKLGDGAWAESVPNLEIETNDVRCSHASAVGPIDEDQRFYLESRGVPPQIAERLIVLGFFDEVLAALPVPGLYDELRAQVALKLERRDLP